jgi:Tol biopolymer transport system component/DNA-binding winged helix-turn-helix (wHTH) protein
VDLRAGEVRKHGILIRHQDQPFRVLQILLERPGEVVTREELQEQIWPADTFVDFDRGLNNAVKRLRDALSDSADNPRYIETLPKRGYRFIAPINGHTTTHKVAPPQKDAVSRTRKWVWVAAGAAALGLFCMVALFRVLGKPAARSSSAVEVVPLIAMDGKQGWPAFSPDGKLVAFAEYEGQHPGIYTTLPGGERPLRLTEDDNDCCPAWSPDGRQIAFVRRESSARSIYTVSALGGAERKLYTGAKRVWTYCDGMDWSPTGNALAFPEVTANPEQSRISLLSLADLSVKSLTSPAAPDSDCEPAFSPDGSSLVFVRGMAGGNFGDLFVSPATGGEPRQLTFDNSGGTFTWTPDGQDLLFSSALGGLQTLWRVSVSGGTPRPVTAVPGPAVKPSISRIGGQLVYQQAIKNDNVWRIDLQDEKHSLGSPARAFSSRGFIYRPNFSPDGKKVAFESDRLGYSDIWVCDRDGNFR